MSDKHTHTDACYVSKLECNIQPHDHGRICHEQGCRRQVHTHGAGCYRRRLKCGK